MWGRRFAPRTEVPGRYPCGVATHTSGRVIGVNGPAMAVLAGTPP